MAIALASRNTLARADGFRDSEIMVMNADGTGRQNLTNYAPAYDVNPAWSPDGTKIAFATSALAPASRTMTSSSCSPTAVGR